MCGFILLIYNMLCFIRPLPCISCRCNPDFMPKNFNSMGMKSGLHRSVFLEVEEKVQKGAKFRPEKAGTHNFGRRLAWTAFGKAWGKRRSNYPSCAPTSE